MKTLLARKAVLCGSPFVGSGGKASSIIIVSPRATDGGPELNAQVESKTRHEPPLAPRADAKSFDEVIQAGVNSQNVCNTYYVVLCRSDLPNCI